MSVPQSPGAASSPSEFPRLPALGFAPLRQGKGPGTWRRRGGAEGWERGGQREETKDEVKCDWCIVGLQRLLNEWMNL